MRGNKTVPYATVRSASREMRQRLAAHDYTVTFGERIGGGQQGSIFKTTITFDPTLPINKISCVAKLSDGQLPSPSEFQTHELISASSQLPSSESGVLTSIGVHRTGTGISYLLLPLCDLMLSDCLEGLQPLSAAKDAETQRLFRGIMLTLFKSLVAALNTLSQHKRIHGDIKPENWGLRRDKEGQLQLCLLDLGLSKPYPEYKNIRTIAGSPHYLAPDAIAQENRFPFEIDVYAFGQIMYDLLGKKQLYQGDETVALLFKKGEAYIAERELHSIKSSKERKKDQGKLLSTLTSYKDFDDCLEFTVMSMLETLPDLRPNFHTLKCTLRHLTDLLQPDPALEKRVSCFWDKMAKKRNGADVEPSEEIKVGIRSKTEPLRNRPKNVISSQLNQNHLFSSRNRGRCGFNIDGYSDTPIGNENAKRSLPPQT